MNTSFSDWLLHKYIEWRGDSVGNERSLTDYAKQIGVGKVTLSNWLNRGSLPTSKKTISLLEKFFGFEIYEVLGLTPPSSPLDSLPFPLRRRIEAAVTELNTETILNGIDPDSPEALELASRVFEKFGLVIKSIDTES